MAQTAEDIAAARRILGLEPPGLGRIVMPQTELRNAVSIMSSDGTKSYNVERRPDTVHGGTYLYCPCVAWRYLKGKGKDCRHVQAAAQLGMR